MNLKSVFVGLEAMQLPVDNLHGCNLRRDFYLWPHPTRRQRKGQVHYTLGTAGPYPGIMLPICAIFHNYIYWRLQ